jgi:hypothetical protein
MKEFTAANAAGNRNVANRLTVRCQTCGRSVKRRSHTKDIALIVAAYTHTAKMPRAK